MSTVEAMTSAQARSLAMCPRIFVSSFLLLLLTGCTEPGYLVASRSDDLSVTRHADGTQMSALRYTNHRATAVAVERVPLRISGPFSVGDRAKILRAVNEWNVALNGFVRFDILPENLDTAAGKSQPRPWMIVASRGNAQPSAFGSGSTLAFTYAIPNAGGLMAVYVDRIGNRDLGSVVMHELGHVLGLGHDTKGGLMSAHYHPRAQQCVDRGAVEAVAAKRRLPVNQLNWCETNVASASRQKFLAAGE